MKKNSIFAAIALLCLLVSSCSDTLNEPVLETKNDIEYHGVPVEDALEYLNAFLATNDESTRSNGTRRIGSVNVVRNKDLATRSSNTAIANADSLIYVVNFEDNQGFAYLAADDRISAPIIYVADSGNISTSSLGGPINGNPQKFYEGFPLTGPGLFYDDSVAPGVLFMNPNTFERYNSEYDDYYTGDFFLNGDTEYQDMISQVNDLVLNFVGMQIGDGSGNNTDFDMVYWEGATENPDNGPNVTDIKTTISIRRDTIVEPILAFAKRWGQESPFNDKCPMVKEYWLLGRERKASAGCVPLAITKIMAHHQIPNGLTINGAPISWNFVKNLTFTLGKGQTATLLKYIGNECLSIYTYQGTFTFPSLAAAFLRNNGFSGVHYINYNHNFVINMLNNNCPVFVCAIPLEGEDSGLDKCHAWNIDGYMIHTTTTRKEYYEYDKIVDTKETTSNKIMVHCDFGWEGYCNGYFTSGIFDLGGEDAEFDSPEHYKTYDVYYNCYLKMIRYNKPQ